MRAKIAYLRPAEGRIVHAPQAEKLRTVIKRKFSYTIRRNCARPNSQKNPRQLSNEYNAGATNIED